MILLNSTKLLGMESLSGLSPYCLFKSCSNMHLGTDVGPLGTYEESKDSKFDPLTL